jgi:hypothetical protein
MPMNDCISQRERFKSTLPMVLINLFNENKLLISTEMKVNYIYSVSLKHSD